MASTSVRSPVFKAPRVTCVDLPWTWYEYEEGLFINNERGDTAFTLKDMITEELEEIIKPSINRLNRYIEEWDEDLYERISNIR